MGVTSKVILDCGLAGYAVGIENKAWDELVVEPLRGVLGDAEQYCVNACIIRMGMLAAGMGEPEIALVFDSRPQREAQNERVFRIFQRAHANGGLPSLDGIAFLNPEKTKPLQGADLVAYEYYRLVCDLVAGGGSATGRPHWRRLEESGRFTGEVFARAGIQEMVKNSPMTSELAATIRATLGLG